MLFPRGVRLSESNYCRPQNNPLQMTHPTRPLLALATDIISVFSNFELYWPHYEAFQQHAIHNPLDFM